MKPAGNTGQVGWGSRGRHNGIKQLLGRKATRCGVRIVYIVIFVPLMRRERPLIGMRTGNRSQQMLQIKLMSNKITR